tara:strand:- start:3572 stop:4330 length:759 start_codon:yes stop_codon:yes gene_type:complete
MDTTELTKDILRDYFADHLINNEIFDEKKKLLVIFLGVLGDFDSFEYCQNIFKILESINKSNINLIIVGIGNEKSKECFSSYTGIPKKYIFNVENNLLHQKLNLYSGLNYKIGSINNMLLMCAGINSPGTIKEVIRGYTGDKTSSSIYKNNQKIVIKNLISLNSNIFNYLGSDDFLRPFELATLRLTNLIEVLNKWNLYIPNVKYITQRGASYIFDVDGKLIYSFISKNLLGYSYNMNNPLSFLKNQINIDE